MTWRSQPVYDYFVAYPDGSRTPFMTKADARSLAPNFRGTVHRRDAVGGGRPSATGGFSAGQLFRAVGSVFAGLVGFRRDR